MRMMPGDDNEVDTMRIPAGKVWVMLFVIL